MKTPIIITALAAIGMAASAASAQSERQARQIAAADERLAEFTVTGETDTCLSLRQVERVRPLDDTRFLIETRGGDSYLSEIRGRCSGAADNFTYLQYRTSGSQLCRGEIVQVLDQSTRMLRGSCSLGEFQRLDPREPASAAG